MGVAVQVMIWVEETCDTLVWHVEGVGVGELSVNHLHQWCLIVVGVVTQVTIAVEETYDALVWHEGVGVGDLSVNHLHQWCLVAVGAVTLVMVGEGETYDALVWHAVGVGMGDPSVGLECMGRSSWTYAYSEVSSTQVGKHCSDWERPGGSSLTAHKRERRVPLQQVTLCMVLYMVI